MSLLHNYDDGVRETLTASSPFNFGTMTEEIKVKRKWGAVSTKIPNEINHL